MKAKSGFNKYILGSTSDNRVIIIRLIVGLIFLSEGVQRLLIPPKLEL